MITRQGHGFLLRAGDDAPYGAWLGVRQLDAAVSIFAAPWEALRSLGDLARLLPAGLALLWNAPADWLLELPEPVRAGFLKGLGHLPGLSLHVHDEAFGALLQEPVGAWHHGPRPPTGALGQAWRQGWLGWVPEAGPGWSLPGLGAAAAVASLEPEEVVPGFLWGEAVLPLGALGRLDLEDLRTAMADLQSRTEQNLSLRLDAEAWPAALPFQRRRAGWRLALLGGREFQSAGGAWEQAAGQARDLAQRLSGALRCPIHLAVSMDPTAAAALGRQAVWEDLPWRSALPLPPAPPAFTPGLGADPREACPPESRCTHPAPLARVLAEPPAVPLRVPGVPTEASAAAFLATLERPPAIWWLPPDLPPPGPFLPDRAWASANAYPPLAGAGRMEQPSLFADWEAY